MRFLSYVFVTLATLVVLQPQVRATSTDFGGAKGLPPVVVDGVTCTLSDAVRTVQGGMAVGGCSDPQGTGVISLQADSILTQASPFSTAVGGAEAGLPDITGAIVINGNGHTIERDSALSCEPNGIGIDSAQLPGPLRKQETQE